MFEHINILFWGIKWDSTDIYHVNQNGDRSIKIQLKSINHIADAKIENDATLKLIGFEIHCKCNFSKNLVDFIKKISLEEVGALYFAVTEKKDISIIMDVIRELSLGEVELYGIDPDYYFSLVPLTGENCRRIEKYILGLKTDFSIQGKVKQIIKNLLVNLHLSNWLYEGFVILVQRPLVIERKIIGSSNC
ncbi:MAG: hypothetical protein ACE5G1_07105 [bacterium]